MAEHRVMSDASFAPRITCTLSNCEAAMAEPGEDISAEAVWAEVGIADDE